MRTRLGFPSLHPPAPQDSPELVARAAATVAVAGVLGGRFRIPTQPEEGRRTSNTVPKGTYMWIAAIITNAIRIAASTSQSHIALVAAVTAAEGAALSSLDIFYSHGGLCFLGYDKTAVQQHYDSIIDAAVKVALAAVEESAPA